MLKFQFISAENNKFRILYTKSYNSNTIEHICHLDEIIDISIRLNSLINEINKNLHKKIEIFEQFKNEAKVLFDLCFSIFINEINQEKNNISPKILMEFDENLGFIPFEYFFSGTYFLSEHFQLIRNIPSTFQENINFNNNEINFIGNLSSDIDINNSIEDELIKITELFENNKIASNGPIMGPFGNKHEIINLFSSSHIFHYSGHYIHTPNNQNGWKWRDGKVIEIYELFENKNYPQFIFSNTCGIGNEKHHSNFYYQLKQNGINSILYASGLINTEFSKKFAIIFYSELLKGTNVSQSLLNTKKIFINKYGYSNPCWLQYNFLGNPDFHLKNIKKKPESGPISFILISLFIILSLFYSIFKFSNWIEEKFESKLLYIKPLTTEKFEIFNSYGNFVNPKEPIVINDNSNYTFYSHGYDTLKLNFDLKNSAIKINSSVSNMFIFDNKLNKVLQLIEDTLFINLLNNGLCDINIFHNSAFQISKIGIRNLKNKNLKRNWTILDTNINSIKINPYFQNELSLLLFQNNQKKYFILKHQFPKCEIKIDILNIWNHNSKYWEYIGH